MSLRLIVFGCLLLILCSSASMAQDEDPIRVESSIVRLNVGVVDQRGRPITDLTKADFTVFEDGVRQEIAKFEPSTAPFSVVMILDMSGSTLGFRQVIKQSAMRFLDAISPDDRLAVVEFYDKVRLRNDFTNDRSTIFNSVQQANGRGKSPLYKAIDFAMDKLAKEGTRRKAIVVLTDGRDTEVEANDTRILESIRDELVPTAIRPESEQILNRVLGRSDAQGVTIYPLALPSGDPYKLADPTPRQIAKWSAARARLQIVAERTGGTLNTINALEDMGRLYAQVAADMRALYTVEYTPTNDRRDGKFRKISITVSNSEQIARTRQGYFPR
ncbi:MAG: VWA domain-containing protein [Blastocatellia bacterium]|nr:VWA domain-containing protein [Blastocatellia bacterium]